MDNREATIISILGHLLTLANVSGALINAIRCGPVSYEVCSLWSKKGGMHNFSCKS